jgi:hypothetical protein
MKQIFSLILLVSTQFSLADVVSSGLYAVDQADSKTFLIKFANGRVAYLAAHKKNLLSKLKLSSAKDEIRAELDHNYQLLDVQNLGENIAAQKSQSLFLESSPPTYSPTVLANLKEVEQIFKRLNSNYKRASECSNRAHVWAWEEFIHHNINSKKVFVLFTASYINRNHFKWWFHVAPLVTFKTDNGIEERVLDYMFDRRPKTIKEWTDNFVFSHRACKETTKFSEYDINPQTEDCYLMTDTMFTWNPIDLKNQERQGSFKSAFSQFDIRMAYDQAFK